MRGIRHQSRAGVVARRLLVCCVLWTSPVVAAVGVSSGLARTVWAAAERTGIEWDVQPANVEIYLDKKKLGEAGKLKFTEAKPGAHSIRLVLGRDETEADIVVKKGQTVKFSFVFDQS